MLTPDDVRDIVRVLDSTTLDEFQVQTGDVDVTLRRHGSSGWTAEALVTRAPRQSQARDPHTADPVRAGQDGQLAPESVAVSGLSPDTKPAAVSGLSPDTKPGAVAGPSPASEPGSVDTGGSAAVDTGGSAAVDMAGSAAVDTGGSAAVDMAGSAAVDTGGSAAVDAARLHRVTPPLLGTFYRAPQPGAAPFVEVGSIVEAETVVGIIETMKMMNPVHAGVAGRIVRICLADAAFAEAGATLILIEERP